jgi:hypothetical protein
MGGLCRFLPPPLHSGSLPQCPESPPDGRAVKQIAVSWAIFKGRAYHHSHMEDHWVPHALKFEHVCGGLPLAEDGPHASPRPPLKTPYV